MFKLLIRILIGCNKAKIDSLFVFIFIEPHGRLIGHITSLETNII